jgi:hypothetical protein
MSRATSQDTSTLTARTYARSFSRIFGSVILATIAGHAARQVFAGVGAAKTRRQGWHLAWWHVGHRYHGGQWCQVWRHFWYVARWLATCWHWWHVTWHVTSHVTWHVAWHVTWHVVNGHVTWHVPRHIVWWHVHWELIGTEACFHRIAGLQQVQVSAHFGIQLIGARST